MSDLEISSPEDLREEIHQLTDENLDKFEDEDDEPIGQLQVIFGEDGCVHGWTRRDDTDAKFPVLIHALVDLIDGVDEEVHLQSDAELDRGEVKDKVIAHLIG